jgi:hypothetical protein
VPSHQKNSKGQTPAGKSLDSISTETHPSKNDGWGSLIRDGARNFLQTLPKTSNTKAAPFLRVLCARVGTTAACRLQKDSRGIVAM